MASTRNSPAAGMIMRLCGVFAALTLIRVSAFAADEESMPHALSPGVRVRIVAPDIFPGKIVGTVTKVDAESVTVDVPGRVAPVSVMREKIARLELSEGVRSRGIDAAIGAGFGAGIGALGGALAGSNQRGHIVSGGEVAAVCAVLGAGIGALIGMAAPAGERWSEVAASRYRVSFAPRLDHGMEVGLAIKY